MLGTRRARGRGARFRTADAGPTTRGARAERPGGAEPVAATMPGGAAPAGSPGPPAPFGVAPRTAGGCGVHVRVSTYDDGAPPGHAPPTRPAGPTEVVAGTVTSDRGGIPPRVGAPPPGGAGVRRRGGRGARAVYPSSGRRPLGAGERRGGRGGSRLGPVTREAGSAPTAAPRAGSDLVPRGRNDRSGPSSLGPAPAGGGGTPDAGRRRGERRGGARRRPTAGTDPAGGLSEPSRGAVRGTPPLLARPRAARGVGRGVRPARSPDRPCGPGEAGSAPRSLAAYAAGSWRGTPVKEGIRPRPDATRPPPCATRGWGAHTPVSVIPLLERPGGDRPRRSGGSCESDRGDCHVASLSSPEALLWAPRGADGCRQSNLTDVRDMYSVHEGFRRALGDAPGQLGSVHEGDTERARRLADYLEELLWLLHVHHGSEDELLYLLLVAGEAPEQRELFVRHGRATRRRARRASRRPSRRRNASGNRVPPPTCERSRRRARASLETLDEHLTAEEDEYPAACGARHLAGRVGRCRRTDCPSTPGT